MKTYLKVSGLAVVLFVIGSMAYAELANNKGGASKAPTGRTEIASIFPGRKAVCNNRLNVDANKVKECPKSLGSLPLDMGEESEQVVMDYNPETESYTLVSVEMPDEGDVEVSLEALQKAVSSVKSNGDRSQDFKRALGMPCDLLNKKFKIKNIQTLNDKDLKERTNCIRK